MPRHDILFRSHDAEWTATMPVVPRVGDHVSVDVRVESDGVPETSVQTFVVVAVTHGLGAQRVDGRVRIAVHDETIVSVVVAAAAGTIDTPPRMDEAAMRFLSGATSVDGTETRRDVDVLILRAAAHLAGKYNEGMSQELLDDTADHVEASGATPVAQPTPFESHTYSMKTCFRCLHEVGIIAVSGCRRAHPRER